MDTLLVAAGVASALIALIHLFAGGREAARPLLAANGLPPVPKFTLYYCWHLVTIVIAGLAAGYLYSGAFGGGPDVAVAATIVAALFALWSVAMIARHKLHPLRFPQWILFIVVAGLGLMGLIW